MSVKGHQCDLVLPGYGRFTKAWGTTRKAEREARLAVVRDLYNAGQLDVLRAMQEGPRAERLTWAEVLEMKRQKRLHADSLRSDAKVKRPLWAAIDATIPKMGGKVSTRIFYAEALASLQKRAAEVLPVTATVGTLAAVDWAAVWALMEDTSATWRNHVRRAVSAFLTQYLGDKYHPYRRAVIAAMGPKERVAKIPKNVTVDEFWRLMAEVPDYLIPAYVTLAATGMRVGEFLACTEASLRRFPMIHFPDGKGGEGTVEVDPELTHYVCSAIPCTIAPRSKHPKSTRDLRYRRLQRALRKASEATGIPASVHTLRHFYAGEGVKHQPQAFVQQALRHATPDMTQLYAQQREVGAVARSVGTALRQGIPVVPLADMKAGISAGDHPRNPPERHA